MYSRPARARTFIPRRARGARAAPNPVADYREVIASGAVKQYDSVTPSGTDAESETYCGYCRAYTKARYSFRAVPNRAHERPHSKRVFAQSTVSPLELSNHFCRAGVCVCVYRCQFSETPIPMKSSTPFLKRSCNPALFLLSSSSFYSGETLYP